MNVVSFVFYMFVQWHVTLSYNLTGENVCLYTDMNTNRNISRCCMNYEEKNNTCVECRPGFIGMNCLKTCGENYYGQLCENKCECNDTEICHRECGCLQKLYFNNSNMTNDSFVWAESCPTSTNAVLTTTGNSVTQSTQGSATEKIPVYFTMEFLIGVASVCSVCFLFGVGMFYRLHLRKEKGERRVQPNMLGNLEESARIRENPNDDEESAEHLYGACSYEDTCYSTLALRVNNESALEPCKSRQPFYNDNNVYELA